MFGPTIYAAEFGSFSYQIKRPKRGEYTLWLGGCRIGKPNTKGEVWQFTAKTLREAKHEMRESAKRELRAKISVLELSLDAMRLTLKELESASGN